MSPKHYLPVVFSALFLITGCKRNHDLTVGSKNFTEQVILGEIMAQHLEHRLNQKVVRRLNLGGTLLTHQAIMNGEIDAYPEYSGTAISAILKVSLMPDIDVIRERVHELYAT